MTLQVENLRHTYDHNYDNLMTNRKIFFVIWPQVIFLHIGFVCVFLYALSLYMHMSTSYASADNNYNFNG